MKETKQKNKNKHRIIVKLPQKHPFPNIIEVEELDSNCTCIAMLKCMCKIQLSCRVIVLGELKSTCLPSRQLCLISWFDCLSACIWLYINFKAAESQTRFQFYTKFTPFLCIVYCNVLFICPNALHICCFSNKIEIGKFCPPLTLGISHELLKVL